METLEITLFVVVRNATMGIPRIHPGEGETFGENSAANGDSCAEAPHSPIGEEMALIGKG